MSGLELKRMKLELIKVEAARHELEFRIEEKMEEIERLKQHIEVQKSKEEELKEKIKNN